MSNFYIVSVNIENFRGYDKLETPFYFMGERQNSKIILLSGANGLGKTSLLDAIEWCLTGTIYRLESDFNKRCTSQEASTDKANKGILRNRGGEGEQVFVKIEAIYRSEKIIISRTFNGNLDSEGFKISLPTVECEDDKTKCEFTRNLETMIDKFNDTYVCSYDKNIDLYSKGRDEIYEMFSCFYRDHIDAKKIMNNLEEIKKKLETEKVDTEKQLLKITDKKNNSIKIYEGVQAIISNKYEKEEYPQDKIYDDENTNPYNFINGSSKEEVFSIENKLESQIETISKIKLLKIKDELDKFKSYLTWNVRLIDYSKLKQEYISNIKDIDLVKKISIKDLEYNKKYVEDKLIKIKNVDSFEKLEANYANISLDTFLTESAKEQVGSKIFNLRNNKNKINMLNKEIELFDTNNKIIKSIRLIIDGLDGFNEYRVKNSRCPLCGSNAEFLNSKLGEIAISYLGEQDSERQKLHKTISESEIQNAQLLKESISIIKAVYNEILINISNQLKAKEKVDVFLNLCNKYSIDYKLVTMEFLEQNISELTNNLKMNYFNSNREIELTKLIFMENGTIFSKFKNNINYEVFEKLEYNEKLNLISAIILSIERYLEDFDDIFSDKLSLLDVSELDKRINICTYIKSNIQLNTVNQEVSSNIEEEKKISEKAKTVSNEIRKIVDMINNIRDLIKKSEIEQTERIAEPLDKIYRRITRNTNIKRIKFQRAKTQSSNAELKIVDYEGKESQFANILSAGQLSTLAISIFLSKAMVNKDNDLRCYFMDEPIQTMDDLNILSFVDLLRFQLNSNNLNEKFIDQIFISTCDSDLGKLIMHKMSSFKIPICEYRFEGPNNFKRNLIE